MGRGVLREAPSRLQGRSDRCVVSDVGHRVIYVYEKREREGEVEHPILMFHISFEFVINRSEPFQALSPRNALDGVTSWLAFVIFLRSVQRRTRIHCDVFARRLCFSMSVLETRAP